MKVKMIIWLWFGMEQNTVKGISPFFIFYTCQAQRHVSVFIPVACGDFYRNTSTGERVECCITLLTVNIYKCNKNMN